MILFRILLPLVVTVAVKAFSNDTEAEDFLKIYEKEASERCNLGVKAEWAFTTDVNNKDKEQQLVKVTLENAKWDKEQWDTNFQNINLENFESETIKRQLKQLTVLGNAALDAVKLEELTNIGNEMTNIYSTAKICPFSNPQCNIDTQGLSLDPDIESIMTTSTNYSELQYVWKAWHANSGGKMKEQFKKYVKLSNEVANANRFGDKGKMWISDFESPNFIKDMDKLWQQVKPLYDELHAYTARKLKDRYKDEIDISDGLIPAHVFGNMWAQHWGSLSSILLPYPNATKVDVTQALIDNKYTVLKMFETANDFYMSLGLPTNEVCYDTSKGAIIEKPEQEMLCHASAWDFCDGKDFRVKMCTKVNFDDFVTIHHEMGHIQYFILYKGQPISLRTGANPGFHEAIGDTIALSVSTSKHLEKIGLLKNYTESKETGLNALMEMALQRVAFLPFGLLIDKWRWDVFEGSITQDQWNSHWWDYRKTIQKVKPPVERSDKTDFDPGAKYHVPGDTQYISYFVSHILQFQLYRDLCKAAGEYDPNDANKPLYQCDFYKSTVVGDKLKAGLSLGLSKHWSKALEAMTNSTELDATAILEYFKPLSDYLKEQNNSTPSIRPMTGIATILIGLASFLLSRNLGA